MYLDSKWLLSGAIDTANGGITGQALTGTSAAASTNSIDVGTTPKNGANQVGFNQDCLYLVVTAKVASGGTNPTLAIAVQTDNNSTFSSVDTLQTVNVGALVEGQTVVIPVPWTNKRYIRLQYTQGGTSPTNTVVAALTTKPQQWTAFANEI